MNQAISLNAHFVAEFEQLRIRLQAAEHEAAPQADNAELMRLREEAASLKSKWEGAADRIKSLELELNRARTEKAETEQQLQQARTRPAEGFVPAEQLETQRRTMATAMNELQGQMEELKRKAQEADNYRKEWAEAIEERNKANDRFNALFVKYRGLQNAVKELPKKV